jgi:hypothetical protein
MYPSFFLAPKNAKIIPGRKALLYIHQKIGEEKEKE